MKACCEADLRSCWNSTESNSTYSENSSYPASTLVSRSFQSKSNFTGISRDTISKSAWSESQESPFDKIENPFLLVGLKPLKHQGNENETQKTGITQRVDEILFDKINERNWKLQVDQKVKKIFDWESEIERLLEID